MTKREEIYKKLIQLNYTKGIDTKSLASILNMSRANLSHELNELCKEGKLYKSSGRPVLFFLSKDKTQISQSPLDLLEKNNISLKNAIEQAKAAILYPPKGMNSLILGKTGVGKSMFASLMHDYAVKMNMKSKDSPFIIFNCADYSNNPQLLTSQLFGVKKGAYTGAETDKEGLIEQADGGILFLDEIHRLPPEGQEALFIFLDTGTFRRLGDSTLRHSDVLIISATTENPNSVLLDTFTRRIPVTINIPSLKERTLEERLFLIKNFFKYESIRINKEIYVSLNSMRALLSYECPNNIGQLKSDVQLLCAKAYSEFLTNVRNDVRIHSSNLPPYIKEGLYKEKEHRILWNNLMSEEIEFFRFNGDSEDTIVDYITSKLPIRFDNNLYTAFALHINTLVDRIHSNKTILNPNLEKIKELYPKEFSVASEAKSILSDHLHTNIPIDEAGYITLFLIPDSTNSTYHDKVKVILIAHGESTATSMSDVANTLLGENYVLPINAPIDVPPSKVLEHLKLTIKDNPTNSGYLLLVDMGSLIAFADTVREDLGVNLKVISLVSTLHVLESARKALLGLSLDEIYNDVMMINSYLQIHKNLNNKILNTSKVLILTACLTGDGASSAMKDFLASNLKIDNSIFQIICLSCLDKNDFKDMILNFQSNNDVLFLVSSFPVNNLNIKQYSMSEALSGKSLKEMQSLIDTKTALLNIPNVINETVPELPGEELSNDVNKFINNVTSKLSNKLSSERLVGLILHISFLISKLIKNDETPNYPGKEDYIKNNYSVYQLIKENILPLKTKYNIKLSDNDICYLIKHFSISEEL